MSRRAGPSQELTSLSVAAVLGSDRAGKNGEAPSKMLDRAAVAGARARAGRRSNVTTQPIEPCPVEARAVATLAQGATLTRLLASPDAAMITEWCALAGTRGVRVPPESVPVVLDWWARQPHRAPDVFDATGACGAWLAGLNMAWRKPVVNTEIPENAADTWQTGTSAERTALLTTIRKIEPARALSMVQDTWGADGADDRRKFVEVLGQGVSARDEAFLEAALDDRSKTVRREAARVLTCLAGSALRARMQGRALSMIIVDRGKAGLLRRAKTTITIEPPHAFDKAWERDGIEEEVGRGKGKRAFWMRQVLSASDLAAWSAHAGVGAEKLVEAIRDDEYADDVLAAMFESIARCPTQPDAAVWGDAIIAACAGQKLPDQTRLASVWNAQTVERSEAMRLTILGGAGAPRGSAAWDVLVSDPRAWSLEFSTRAMKALRSVTPKKPDSWEFWAPIESVSRLVHPGAASLFEGLLGDLYPDGPSESVRKSLERVRLRADMHREFQP